MKIIRQSNENEMLLEFLRGEIDSKRFGEMLKNTVKELGFSEDLIRNANLDNQVENERRKLIMEKFRQYPTGDIFERFPKEIKWVYVEFEEGDIDKIFYINWSYWNEMSNYTSKPIEAAKSINKGVEYFNIPNDRYFNGLQSLENGKKFEPIIAITYNGEKIALIEGHSRMTVYGLKPEFFTGTFGYIGFCSKEEMEFYDSRMI